MREHLHLDIAWIRQTNARYLDEGEVLKEFNALQVKLMAMLPCRQRTS